MSKPRRAFAVDDQVRVTFPRQRPILAVVTSLTADPDRYWLHLSDGTKRRIRSNQMRLVKPCPTARKRARA